MNPLYLLLPLVALFAVLGVCVALGRWIAREADRYPTAGERRLLREIDRHAEAGER